VADYLVTGTDTGVGKTVVAAALVLAARASGLSAVGFKPVETGVVDEGESDAALLARATGHPDPLAAPLLSLAEALAPAVAAGRAGAEVDPEEIEHRVRALRDKRYDAVVVEGAGGVAVPITWGWTALDLARHLGLLAVVVARPGLGTLNHVWLTVEALSARHVPVAAIVLNGVASPPDLAEETNPGALARLLPRIPRIVLPRIPSDDRWQVAQEIAPLVRGLVAVAG
jgi:dethiobiotin synthetase